MSPSPENAQESDVGFDPDEDLFAFGNPASSAPLERPEHEESEDLEEIFASFEEEEARASALAPPNAAGRERLEPQDHAAHASAAPRSSAGAAAHAAPPSPPKAAQPPRRTVAAPLAPPRSPHAPSTTSFSRPTADRADAPQTRRTKVLSGTSLVVLAAVVLVNALVALVTLRTAADLQAKLAGKASHASAAEHAARPDASESTSPELARDASDVEPIPPDPEAHPVFEGVRQDLARGDYGAARRRLYALLAVIDRLEPAHRREVEARAHYALARARHLEAVARMEAGR